MPVVNTGELDFINLETIEETYWTTHFARDVLDPWKMSPGGSGRVSRSLRPDMMTASWIFLIKIKILSFTLSLHWDRVHFVTVIF